MVFHTLVMTIMTLSFSISIGLNASQTGTLKLSNHSLTYSKQSLALFMPVEKKIVTDVTSSNDDSC